MKYIVVSFNLKTRTIDTKKYLYPADNKREALEQVRYWVDVGYCPCIMTKSEYDLYESEHLTKTEQI